VRQAHAARIASATLSRLQNAGEAWQTPLCRFAGSGMLARMNHHPRFMEIKQEQDKAVLVLSGDWTIENATPIEQEIERAAQELDQRPYAVVAEQIGRVDTSGAFLIKKLTAGEKAPPRLSSALQPVLNFLPDYSEYTPPAERKRSAFVTAFSFIGERTFRALDFSWDVFAFVGRVFVRFLSNLMRPRHFRLPSIVRHIQETGIAALPIIGLLGVLMTMVITYQGAIQLRRFGADIYTIDLTVISLLREMGVLITAIMVAGRSGSAFAAEIGVMTLRDEVSALRTMGMDPIEVLVLPRVIALLITLPLLTFLADVIGLFGGGLMSMSLLNISFGQYVGRVAEVATPTTFFIGMIKAPVFAFIIAIIGCYQGLKVSGSAESVGRRTTLAVVQAIFVVIMADGLFSIAFSEANI
jgi:phospholipid/cholesterol/gamma-HCH transport system permease protein